MKAYIQRSWRRAIAEGVTRNSPLALRRRFDGDEESAPPTFPSRLLAARKDGSLIIERPTQNGVSEILQPGLEVDLFVQEGQQCWAGRCEVLGLVEDFQLNVQTQVCGVHVARPSEVWSGQRRSFYRVDSAASGIEAFVVQVLEGDLRPSKKLHGGETFQGEGVLSDLSAGGVGLRLPLGHDLTEMEMGQRVRCQFRLPSVIEQFDLLAEVIRTEETSPTHMHLGLKFVFKDRPTKTRTQRMITRFATQLEREQIRRLRGTG